MVINISSLRQHVLALCMVIVLAGAFDSAAQTLAEGLDTTNVVWATGGDAGWFAQTTNTHDGFDAVRSASIGSNQTSWIETTFPGPATVKFWAKTVASEFPSGQATMTLNGSEQWVFGWYSFPMWNESVIDFGPGTNVIRWAVLGGNDTSLVGQMYLDEFQVLPPRPLEITYFGSDQAVDTGMFAIMGVVVVGTPPIQFQWRKDGSEIAGATNESFVINSAVTNDSGIYSVTVSNSQGFVISSNSVLTVLPPAAPSFTHEPTSVTAYAGQYLTLSGSVGGSRPFTFQWRKNGTNVTEPFPPQLWGSSSLTLTNVGFASAGNYTLFVTNDYGSVESSNAVLTVIPSDPPVITKHPRSLEVAEGVNTWMSVAASGDPTPTYKWTKVGDVPLPPPPPGPPPPPIISQPSQPKRSFTNSTPADAGVYFAIAKNFGGEVNSREALLTVLPPISNLGSWWQGAVGIFVTNGLAFLAQGSAGFSILSVSNPAAPVMLGGHNTPGYASAVCVVGNSAYIADGSAGLQIFSVTNPFNPTLVGSYNTPDYASDLIVRSNLAYVAARNSGLLIINVSNPASPALVGMYSTNLSPNYLALSGDYAYLTSLKPITVPGSNYWVGGMAIVNVSNPALPFEAGRYGSSFTRVDVRDRFVFATAGSGLLVLDVLNPAQPQLISLFNSYGNLSHLSVPVDDFQVINDRAFLVGSPNGVLSLLVLDIRDPSEMIPVGYHTATGQDHCLFVEGDRIYVSGSESNLKIIGTPFSNLPSVTPTLSLSVSPEMHLNIQGRRGSHYDVEHSAAPGTIPWQPLHTLLLTNQTASVPITLSSSNGFFRLKQVD